MYALVVIFGRAVTYVVLCSRRQKRHAHRMAEKTAASHDGWLHSVSLALFDVAVGNTIAYTAPASDAAADGGDDVAPAYLGGRRLMDVKGLQDFCFPDGGHDSYTDYVPIAVRLVPRSGNNNDWNEESDMLYGLANYHLLRDAKVERGARQRGILFLTHRPCFHALKELCVKVVTPLLQRHLVVADGDGAGGAPESPATPASPAGSPVRDASRAEEAAVLRRVVDDLYTGLRRAFASVAEIGPTPPGVPPGADPLSQPFYCGRTTFRIATGQLGTSDVASSAASTARKSTAR